MTKTKSTILLIILLVVLAFLCVFSVMPEILVGSYAYHSPLNLLNLGSDLGKSVVGVYEVEKPDDLTEEDYSAKINESLKIIRKRLSDFNLQDASFALSQTSLTVRMKNTDDAISALSLVNQKGEFALSSSNDATKLSETTLMTNKNITKVSTGYSSSDGIYYMKIDIDDTTAALIKASTASATSSSPVTMYFYFDGVLYKANNLQATSQYTYSSLYVYATDGISLEIYKSLLNNGILPLDVTYESYGYAAPLLGEYAALISGIFVLVIAVAIIVALIIRFKLFGLASALSFLVYILAVFLLISLVYLPAFDIGALLGAMFAMALYLYSSVYFLNTVNGLKEGVKEQNSEKQLTILLGRARRHVTLHLLRIHAVLFAASLILWIFGVGVTASFAVVLTYASVLSLLANLFVSKLFESLFIAISPDLNLYYSAAKKEEKV